MIANSTPIRLKSTTHRPKTGELIGDQTTPSGGLRSTSFKPGVSCNPGGRPKRPRSVMLRFGEHRVALPDRQSKQAGSIGAIAPDAEGSPQCRAPPFAAAEVKVRSDVKLARTGRSASGRSRSFGHQQRTSAVGRLHQFAAPSANGRYLRISLKKSESYRARNSRVCAENEVEAAGCPASR